MEINKYEILLALEEDPKSRTQLIERFGKSIDNFLNVLTEEGLVLFNWDDEDLIQITPHGRLELDSDYCEACECSPCDCNWGTDE